MSDVSPGTVASFLSTLRTLPVWLLGALAATGYAMLFFPGFGGVSPAAFRSQWGTAIWIATLAFSILTVARGVDSAIATYHAQRAAREARRALRLVPRHHQRWWHLAKQQDDSYGSQIALDIEVANVTDYPVRIVKVNLLRPKPKGEIWHADAVLPASGSRYHSDRHAVPPHDTATASLHLMMRGALAPQGKSLVATISITDQFGEEYFLRGIRIPTTDPAPPMEPLKSRVVSGLRALLPRNPPQPEAPPAQWKHGGKFEQADLILNEEKRNYVARGRERGGLGSLNVGLQSEPNMGVTQAGAVPSLLWDRTQARPVDSPNATRLLRLHAELDDAGKTNLEQYLLSHLHRQSDFASVGYFIFLVLHRLGRTIDAVRAARARLAGDKVYGYSNVLGTLSALLSREHFAIDPVLYPELLDALKGDTEYNFNLSEKINLARIHQFDRKSEGQPRDATPSTDHSVRANASGV